MEQHPIPRQITSFEFKLIGFMTLHQFIYLLVFVPMGFAIYKIIPIPVLNILFGIVVSGAGVLLAFLPVNDRPLDVFIKNLYKRLTSPTQYLYKKTNQPLSFLDGSSSTAGRSNVVAHVDSQEKLSKYLQSKPTPLTIAQSVIPAATGVKAALEELPLEVSATKLPTKIVESIAGKEEKMVKETTMASDEHQPFFMGVVKNAKEKPLPEILVYLKDESDNPIRLLKTNPHGVFATYSSVPKGDYLMEAKDPRGSYLFDTMKIRLGDSNPAPFTMLSKGML